MNRHDRSWNQLMRSKTMREIEEAGDPWDAYIVIWDAYIVIVSVILLVWILLGAPL